MDLERRLERGPLRVAPLWSARQGEQLPQRVLQRRRERAFARVGAGVAMAVAIAAGGWFFSQKPSSGMAVRAVASTQPARAFTLADGSKVSLLTAGSRIDVVEQTRALVRARLGAGSAHFDVHHDPTRVFEVECGDVKVRVLGTAFSLVHEGLLTRVAVERGAVRVSWPGGEAQLAAGQSGVYPPPRVPSASPDASAVPSAEPALELAGEAADKSATWRKLAKRGDYANAYQALAPVATKGVRDEPSDLMLAADVARLSRHPADATRYLSRVVEGFPRDKRAPLAAFTLGRVLLEDLGQPARAADAFGRAQQLAPRGPLASDALAREVEAARRAGQLERAKQAASRYLELYPEGPQADRLRKP